MKVKFMPEYEAVVGSEPLKDIIVFEVGGIGWSTFKLSKEKVEEICPILLEKEELVEIDQAVFTKLQDAFQKERYKNVTLMTADGDSFSVSVNRNTDMDILHIINKAYREDQAVFVQFKDGFGGFPSGEDDEDAIYSEDGRAHIINIGISTGEPKSFIQLDSPNAMGGDMLMLDAIEKAITDPDERVLYKELQSYEKACADDRMQKLVDAQREKNLSRRENASNTADAPKQGNKP